MSLRVAPPRAAGNVSAHLRLRAAEAPGRTAIVAPDGQRIAFGDLERRCDAIARGLAATGLVPGDRVCLFVRPGIELIALTHGLFRAGLVPVLIDPGVGRRSLLSCVERAAPRGLVGIPRAHVARLLFPRAFASVEHCVTVGPRLAWGGQRLAGLERRGAGASPFAFRSDDPQEEAAILFTSGSTGPPKGVVYRHGNFLAQLEALRGLYDLRAGEVDVACFPLFALFDNALGMTSVFPPMDPSRPAACDPARIHGTIEAHRADFTFGSPAIWKRVAAWAHAHGARFTSLRRLTIAGAPVAPSLVAALRELLPAGGEVHTPYGATECLPVSNAAGSEVAGDLRARIEGGAGTCVGRPLEGLEVALVRITDEPLDAFDDSLRVAPGEPGEVCVRGAVATPAYLHDRVATRLAKIRDGEGFWHRMGDVGLFDDRGRLWLQGRKSHRLETADGLLMPVPLENVMLTVEGVQRVALVGVGPRGAERPVLVVQPEPGADRAELRRRLEGHRRDLALTRRVSEIRFKEDFPVDVRHNAKIRREELRRWAEGDRP